MRFYKSAAVSHLIKKTNQNAQKQVAYTMLMSRGITAAVLVGIAVGVTFFGIFALIFNQSQNLPSSTPSTQTPEPGRFREAAIRLALQNNTLQQIFMGTEPIVTSYREWGVAYSYRDCPIDWCAHMTFADKPVAGKGVSVFVNMNTSKVVEIIADSNLRIAKTNTIEEAKFFLSKYPAAKINVNPELGYSDVIYEAGNVTRFLSLHVKTTPIGEVEEVSAECWRDGSVHKVTTDVLRFIETSDCISRS